MHRHAVRNSTETYFRGLATRAHARKVGIPARHATKSSDQVKRSRIPLLIGGLLVYGASIYIGSSIYRIYYPSSLPIVPSTQTLDKDESHVYDEIATTYDSSIGLDEKLMGLTWLRWNIVRQMSGDVLEVSAGTGRNLPYYNREQITSLTLIDKSTPMLDVARDKASKLGWADRIQFKDTALEGLSPNRDSYDVVLQTFGLCSVSDPVSFLSHLSRFCRADGEIILMEHGRSKYAWINNILDKTVAQHAEKWGCHYNRDIAEIVNACPDIEVVRCQRWHFGTTYIYHLRPK